MFNVGGLNAPMASFSGSQTCALGTSNLDANRAILGSFQAPSFPMQSITFAGAPKETPFPPPLWSGAPQENPGASMGSAATPFKFGLEPPTFQTSGVAAAPAMPMVAGMGNFEFGVDGPAVHNSTPRTNGHATPPAAEQKTTYTSPYENIFDSYKSPFDDAYKSPVDTSYKSPVDTSYKSPYDDYKSPFEDNYKSPYDNYTNNGPWEAPALDRRALEDIEALASTPVPKCWKRVSGDSTEPSTMVLNGNHLPDDPVGLNATRPLGALASPATPKLRADEDEHAAVWNAPPRLSPEEQEHIWSAHPEAVKTRAAMLGPRPHNDDDDGDIQFVVNGLKNWLTSSLPWGQRQPSKVSEQKRPSLPVNEPPVPRTRNVELDMTRMPNGRSASPRTPVRNGNSPLPFRETTRHWWCVKSQCGENDDNLQSFDSKRVVVEQPEGLPSMAPKELLAPRGVSVACHKGNKPGNANHDSFGVVLLDESYAWGPIALYTVYDGHGPAGHRVSQFCNDMLPRMLLQNLKKIMPFIHEEGLGHVSKTSELEEIRRTVEDVFVTMQGWLEQMTVDGAFDCRKSGTTATIVLHGGDAEEPWLLVAHVGDSRAALLRPPLGVLGRPDELDPEVLELTRDHRPDMPSEKARIEKTGSRVEAFHVAKGTVRPMDPRVVTDNQDWPALNMSRCLGDHFSQTQGVIAQPEVRLLDVKAGDKIMICTDGIWDVISPIDAQIIMQETAKAHPVNALSPADALCEEARRRWVDRTKDEFYDDITAMVVDLQQ